VYFSCKITSSILTYLERQGEDTNRVLEATALPEEFLKDPSYWMPAAEMEKFLQSVQRLPIAGSREELLVDIGRATPELRSWGVFDSVLRMMSLQDMFAQPSRFLSYFVSPEPPVDNVQVFDDRVSFDLPIPSDQFPLTTRYLQSAFESLPRFGGHEMAQCRWQGMHLEIVWSQRQNTIFSGTDPGHQISPELMRSIVAQLEQHQMELQRKNADLESRHEQLRVAYQKLEGEIRQQQNLPTQISVATAPVDLRASALSSTSRQALETQVSRLTDYMVRAQQLVTILVGGQRLQPHVQEAMKRVDWEWVKLQFPVTVESCLEILRQTPPAHPAPDSQQKETHV
jgi:hypothetical protein